ncbi:MAG: Na+/H+ antiporter subunit B [Candidatus Promineifilaceae bacterium]|nr:Na+/H+ antiporter subunit B [Candidatus Promineifilaceae bacterium]
MNSLILRAATRIILPVLLLFSLFMLLRGHNDPGGGFIGGLVAAAAVLLHLLAEGPQEVRRTFPAVFRRLLPLGLLTAIVAGLIGMLSGEAFLTGIWTTLYLPGGEQLKIGTPLLFDIGVYMVVVGMTVEVILTMAEEESWEVF